MTIAVDTKKELLEDAIAHVEAAIASESEHILATSSRAGVWAWGYLAQTKQFKDLGWPELSRLADEVGAQLVEHKVLKVDRRKHEGRRAAEPHLWLRVSKGWWNRQQKEP